MKNFLLTKLRTFSPVLSHQSKWQDIFRETRTRLLLIYTILLLSLVSMTIPLFRYLLFTHISNRVRANLSAEREEFLREYANWEAAPNQTVDDLKAFVDQFLAHHLTEDDNFHLILIDGELYRSSPEFLVKPLQPNSDLFKSWQQVIEFMRGEEMVDDPDIGSILYKADPLLIDGQQRGVSVVVHLSAGERKESLIALHIFIPIVSVVLLLSLVLSWLVAGWLMAPIRSLAKTARSVSESDLTQRISSVPGSGELAELTEIFNAMMDRLQKAFESQRDFINDVGHELRTPLTIIRGHLELLEDDPQERQETLKLLLDELDRMGRLVNDMIVLAKSERTDFLQRETIDISSFSKMIFAKAQTLAQRHWILNIAGQGKMVGDHQRLTGALLNLLRNAAQHTQVADTIEFGCRRHRNQQVEFWVKDTGEGISLSDQALIFQRFIRGKHCQYRSEGSGLGLAIVQVITKAHNGQIMLESQVGRGTTFRLILPME